MSWGLEVLALDEDADERTIKRAYAQRLRVTRPDDDPAAFQRLHEAYQAALAWVQQRPVPLEAASAASAHVASGPEPALEPAPAAAPAPADRALADAPPPPPQTVDVAASAHGILARALRLEPGPLRDWLAQQPELWSLYSKPAIGEAVLAQLCNHVPPLSMGTSEVLVETFGWNDLHSGIDPYALHAHRLQMHRSWVVQPRNHGRLAELLRQNGLPSTVTGARDHLAWLSRPWKAWQALLTSLPPMRGRDLNRTLDVLRIDDATDAPAPLRAQQVDFWLRIGQRDRMSVVRGLQGLLRGVAGGLALSALILGYGVLKSSEPDAWPMQRFAELALWALLALTVLGALAPPLHTLLRWQSCDEPAAPRGRYPRLLLIPLLAVMAVVLIHVLDLRMAGTALAWSALVLALVRFWKRSRLEVHFNGWLLLAALPLLKLTVMMVVVAELALVATLVLWLWDGWRNVRGQWA